MTGPSSLSGLPWQTEDLEQGLLNPRGKVSMTGYFCPGKGTEGKYELLGMLCYASNPDWGLAAFF